MAGNIYVVAYIRKKSIRFLQSTGMTFFIHRSGVNYYENCLILTKKPGYWQTNIID